MAEQDKPQTGSREAARAADHERRATALRANLKRRKAQLRGRTEQTAPDTVPVDPSDCPK